jgi:outer membrane protein OmpA-like peptidoglycan-associated protein/Tol biopolymer transport system component
MKAFLVNTALLILLLMLVLASQAQESSGQTVPRARKAFEKALLHWRVSEFEDALRELEKAVRIDPAFADAYILLGDISYDLRDYDIAADAYKRAAMLDSLKTPRLTYLIGKVYFDDGDYGNAGIWLRKYSRLDTVDGRLSGSAESMIRNAEFREYAYAHPVPFKPENLGELINSKHDEYVNSITLDERKLVYTLTQPDTAIRGRYTEGFSMAVNTDSGWVQAGRALPDLHELGNIGAMSLSPDGRFLFFTSCTAYRGYGSCDLYVCGREGEGWSKPQNLGGVVNTDSWDSQPCFSADGKTLYFVSARGGGLGGSDIWHTTFIQDRGWTRPVNAGPVINTEKEEMAPFIHPDGKTMYFSSKGHTGMGGFDLFMSRKDSAGSWGKPENLGWPVNTPSDEINMVVSTNGRAAYLSSRQESGFGGYDIYRFELPGQLMPGRVSYLEGKVLDATNHMPVGAEILLIDLETGEPRVRCESDPSSGYYLAALPGGRNYALNISKPSYLFYSENFNLENMEAGSEPVRKDVYLKPLRSGESFVLNNIFFETDEFSLDERSLVELEKLHALLESNPGIRILIGGHTDNVGSKEYNQELSEKRAEAVYAYLLEAGIDPGRLEYAGYGKSRPVSENLTEEGRALNRRTEIHIL